MRGPELRRWLAEEGRFTPDNRTLLRSLCEKLIELGVPVARATTHIRTINPEFRGVTRIWRRGQSTEEVTPHHGVEGTPEYQRSPLQYITNTLEWVDVRLTPETDERFPILGELRREGFTHYLMAPLVFSTRTVNGMSFATDAPGGFRPEDVEFLYNFVPTLTSIIEVKAIRRIAAELLATYVGRDPARRILDGEIRRGELQPRRGAMLLADMRGFTALADTLSEARVLELLNTFYDCVVPPVTQSGGEVLKYIGDAVFALFPAEDGGARACRAAFAAATAALASGRAHPFSADGFAFGIALHLGAFAYGNVGSGNRLDFTAIGREVNLLARLEQLCSMVDRPLLMSGEFAKELDEPVFEIGHFELRGFRAHQAVYAVCEEGEPACRAER